MNKNLSFPRPSLQDPRVAFATWFGGGYSPFAPGTTGSIVAALLAWPISQYLGVIGFFVIIIVTLLLGVWASEHYVRVSGQEDSPAIVVDEVAGQWLTLVLIPPDIIYYVLGFVIFRIIDIIKPWPISFLDRRVKGGFGVMLDDCIGGILACLIIWNIWMMTNL